MLTVVDWFDVKSYRARMVFGLLALGGFSAGFYWGYIQYREALNVDLRFLIVLAALLPATALANTVRFRLTAQALGTSCSFANAVSISTLSTAANMLPVPGGIIVRVANLKGHSDRLGGAVSATLLTGALSASVTIFLAAAAYLMFRGTSLAAGLFGGAVVILGMSLVLCLNGVLRAFLGKLVLTEVLAALLDTARIAVCFGMIGSSITLLQAMIFTSASVVGSAVSFVPAGLGVREITSAAIAVHLSMVASATFLAVGLNRLFGLAFFMLLSLPIILWRRQGAENVA